jgi:hypothetical protein
MTGYTVTNIAKFLSQTTGNHVTFAAALPPDQGAASTIIFQNRPPRGNVAMMQGGVTRQWDLSGVNLTDAVLKAYDALTVSGGYVVYMHGDKILNQEKILGSAPAAAESKKQDTKKMMSWVLVGGIVLLLIVLLLKFVL